MKKIACLLLGILTLCVCSCQPPQPMVKYENPDGAVIYGRKFELDGHTYIEFFRVGEFSKTGTYDNYTGFEHDPECLLQDLRNARLLK